MRNLNLLRKYRDDATGRKISGSGFAGDHGCGVFRFPSPIDRAILTVVASDGDGWDHVSVSRSNRCPNWPEMEHIKRLFFAESETVMQLHVPASEHINCHPHTLHLWRPQKQDIPRPPGWMVGPKTEDGP
jgi:hypothetical protein